MTHTTHFARIITRLREDQDAPRYAELRTGRMYHGDDEPTLGRADWWIITVAAALLGALIGGITMPETPAPHTGPGFEAACRGGC